MNPKLRTAAALAAAVLAVPSLALASSHREAPAISNDPAADNTDLWAWVKPGTHDKLYVIASYIPLEEPAGGPNFHKFSDDVLYEVHIARGNQSLADVITYQIRFKTTPGPRVDVADLSKGPGGGKEFFSQLSLNTQTYTVTKIVGGVATDVATNVPVAPIRYGPRSQSTLKALGVATSDTYDDAYAATFINDTGAEGRFWAGPRDDGFYVDLGGIFDLANLRAKGTAQDGVAGFNCHTIALEIPTTKLTASGAAPTAGVSDAQTLAIWASASRRKVAVLARDGSTRWQGPWVQVSRLGLPLINEAVIGIQDKDKYNRTQPKDDITNFGAYFLNPIIVRDGEVVGVYGAPGTQAPMSTRTNRTDIVDVINLKNIPTANAHNVALSVTGDVLRVDMGVDSGFPNGRPIPGGAAPNQEQADVTDVLLSLLLLKTTSGVSDGVDYNDKNYLTTFPYLALPWQGFDQGHGKPTP